MGDRLATATYPKGSTWDWTDPDNPQPLIYPVCADCGEAWIYKRCYSLSSGGVVWAWIAPAKIPKGCRHKNGPDIHKPGD